MKKYLKSSIHSPLHFTLILFILIFANSAIAETKFYARMTPVVKTNYHTYDTDWETDVNINNNSDISFSYYWSSNTSGLTFANIYSKNTIAPLVNASYRKPYEIFDINDRNSAVGKMPINGVDSGFYYNYDNQKISYLKKLAPLDSLAPERNFFATSINNDYAITGAGEIDDNIYHALLYIKSPDTENFDWSLINLESLGDTTQNSAIAQDVVSLKNSNNEPINYWVVGYSEIDPINPDGPKTEHAFLYDNGQMKDLAYKDPIDIPSRAYAINSSKMIVGSRDGDNNGTSSPVLFYNDDIIELDNANTPREGEALDVNENGQIVGWYINEEGNKRGFLYENEMFYDLNDITVGHHVNLPISKASGINDQGQISGLVSLSSGINSRPFILDPVLDSLQQLPSIVSPVTRNSDNSYDIVSSYDIAAMGEKWLVTIKNKTILQIYANINEHWRYTSELKLNSVNYNLGVEISDESILLTSNTITQLYTWIDQQWELTDLRKLLPEDVVAGYKGIIDNNSIIIYKPAFSNSQVKYSGEILAFEKIDNNWEYIGIIDISSSPLDNSLSEVFFDQGKLFLDSSLTRNNNIVGELHFKNITNEIPTWDLENTIDVKNKYYGYSTYYQSPYVKTVNTLLQYNPYGVVDTGEYRPPDLMINNIGLFQTIIMFDLTDDSYLASDIISVKDDVVDFSYENNLLSVSTENGQLKVFNKKKKTNYWQQNYLEQITDGEPFFTYIKNGIIMIPVIEQTNDNNGSIKRFYFCEDSEECETEDINNYDFDISGNFVSSIFERLEYKVTIINFNELSSKGYRFEINFPNGLAPNGQYVDPANAKDCSIFSTKIYCLLPPIDGLLSDGPSSKEITFYLTSGAFPNEYNVTFTLDPLYRNSNTAPLEKTITTLVVEGSLPTIDLSYPPNDIENTLYTLTGDSLFATYNINNWLETGPGYKFSWYINETHNDISESQLPIDLSGLDNGQHTLTLTLLYPNETTTHITKSATFALETLDPSINFDTPIAGLPNDTKNTIYNLTGDTLFVNYEITNWLDSSGGFKFSWYINETHNGISDSQIPIDLSGLDNGQHTLTLTLLYPDETATSITKSTTFALETLNPSIVIDTPIAGLANATENTIYNLTGDTLFVNYEIKNWLDSNGGYKFFWFINETHNGINDSQIPIDLSGLDNGQHTLTLTLLYPDGSATSITKSTTFILETLDPSININTPIAGLPNDTENMIFNLTGETLLVNYNITNWLGTSGGYKYSWFINETHNGISDSKMPIDLSGLDNGQHTLTLTLLYPDETATPITKSATFNFESVEPYIHIKKPIADETIYFNPTDSPIQVNFELPSRPFPDVGYKIRWWLNDKEQPLLENQSNVEIRETSIGINTIRAELLSIDETKKSLNVNATSFNVQKTGDLELTIDATTEILASYNKTSIKLQISNNIAPEWPVDIVSVSSIIPTSLEAITKPDECEQNEQKFSCTLVNVDFDDAKTIEIEFASTGNNENSETELLFELISSTFDSNKSNNIVNLNINNTRPSLNIDYPGENDNIEWGFQKPLPINYDLTGWDIKTSPSKIRWTLNNTTHIIENNISQVISATNLIDGENTLLIELIDESEQIVIVKDTRTFDFKRIVITEPEVEVEPTIIIFNKPNIRYTKTKNQVAKWEIMFSTNVLDDDKNTSVRWLLYKNDELEPKEDFIITTIQNIPIDHLDEGKYKLKLELLAADGNPINSDGNAINASAEIEFEIVAASSPTIKSKSEKIEHASTGPLFLLSIIIFYLYRRRKLFH